MSSFLMDAWHMAAWSEEIGSESLSRRICGFPMMLFRKEDGSVAALVDRCPHRFAPLSLGTRDGDKVVCGYHGLGFAADGRCVHNPFSDKLPTGATIRTFPVEERQGIVWVWSGDLAAADRALIPSFEWLDTTPADQIMRGYTFMAANYEYGTDNLMDLSHIEFVHRGSFAGAGVIFAGEHEVIQDGDTMYSNWWMPDVPAPGHTMGIYPRDMRTDHWFTMRWNAPASMHLEIGSTPIGQPKAEGVIVDQAHILTAETEGTTHYFWVTTSSFPLSDPEVFASMKSLFAQAFDVEDKPMIEAAFANLEGKGFWESKPVFLGIDSGGTRTRRWLETMRGRRETVAAGDAPQPASAFVP